MSQPEAERERRFSHLLQPIRDLAENWNIDIASELEDYLAELETISFTFEDLDHNASKLNFAEAALLIQGSACIYSKKVEYLYKLLYQTLDFLSEKRKRVQASSIGEDGVDADAGEQEEPEFLLLDDIEEAVGIDLVEDGRQANHTTNKHLLDNTPNTLAFLVSSSQEEAHGIGERRSDYRMNTCFLHKSGALLLEDRDRLNLDNSLQRIGGSSIAPSITVTPEYQTAQRDSFVPNQLASTNEITLQGIPAGAIEFELNDRNDDSDDEIGNDGENLESIPQKENQSVYEQAASIMANERRTMDTNESNERIRLNTRRTSRQREVEDDWRMLDPHDNIVDDPSAVEKPFKKGRTYRIPKLLQTTKANSRPRKANIIKPGEQAVDKLRGWESFGYTVRSLRGSIFPEFNYLYERVNKMYQIEKRNYREDILATTFNAKVSRKDIPVPEDEEHEGTHNNFDFGAVLSEDEDDDFDNGNDAMAEPIELNVNFDDPSLSVNGAGNGNQGLLFGNNFGTSSTSLQQTYEDLCRSHVDKYLASVSNYVQETALSQRIAAWKSRIEPFLQVQESHPVFDIHKYGETLLQRFDRKTKATTKTKPLITLLADDEDGIDTYDVCRYFASALQLVNDGNIEIVENKDLGTLDFKLLSTKPRFDIQNYRAPSVANKDGDQGDRQDTANELVQDDGIQVEKKKNKRKKGRKNEKDIEAEFSVNKENAWNVGNYKKTGRVATGA